MWHLRIGIIVGLALLFAGCKGNQGVVSEAEQMQASVAEEVESKRNSQNFENEASSVASYSLPKVMEFKMEEGQLHVRLRLNGKCDPHKLKWIKHSDCSFEVRDLTTDDKCMGYQFVNEELKLPENCEKIIVNGRSYP